MNPLIVVRDAWFFTRQHLLLIARVCLPFIVLQSIGQRALQAWLGDQLPPVYEVLVGLICYPLYTAPLILLLAARTEGAHPEPAKLLAGGLLLWPRLGLLAAISTLLIMLSASLFLPLVLWVMTRLAFSEYLLVVNRRTPLNALKDSYVLTSGHLLPTLGCVLIVMLPIWAADIALSAPSAAPRDAITDVLLNSLLGFCQLFATIVLFRLYLLRMAGESSPQD